MNNDKKLNDLALKNFREYLRIPSVHPNPNLDDCVTFFKRQAHSLRMSFEVISCVPKHPIVVLTWKGLEPQLPSIFINGHMDVVPVFEEKWTYPPFGAEMDEKGNIYARGAQDMKCHTIMAIEAIRRLQLADVRLKRTVHLVLTPDEEVGGEQGMKLFVKTEKFKSLNVGFALDEAFSLPDEKFIVFNGEKCNWRMRFHCPGQSGHGCIMPDNSPGEKVTYILNKLYEYRAEEKKKTKGEILNLANVISLNLTMLSGGVQSNVIPNEFLVVVDARLPPTVDIIKWEETLNAWCKEAGEGVWIEFLHKDPLIPPTRIDDSNIYWKGFKKATDDLKLTLCPVMILPAVTDMRFLRELGIPALNFHPINKTIVRAHDHDEYLNKDNFLEGIQIFMKVITEVANAV